MFLARCASNSLAESIASQDSVGVFFMGCPPPRLFSQWLFDASPTGFGMVLSTRCHRQLFLIAAAVFLPSDVNIFHVNRVWVGHFF
jgi:hypothetical protein